MKSRYFSSSTCGGGGGDVNSDDFKSCALYSEAEVVQMVGWLGFQNFVP
jgi:hypothetical protein